MVRNVLTEVADAQLLAEIEDLLRNVPHRDVLGRDNEESHIWLGRASAALRNWDVTAGVEAATAVDDAHSPNAFQSNKGAVKLRALLWRAQADLRLNTVGAVNVAIGEGRPFAYFDEVRKIVGLAKHEVWFIDPYINPDFVAKYLPQVPEGASTRLLGSKYMLELVPAVMIFAQQEKRAIEVRSSNAHHDRFVFIDGAACYQSGASFKDGAQRTVTTITQITDAFSELKGKYEALWAAAKPEFKS